MRAMHTVFTHKKGQQRVRYCKVRQARLRLDALDYPARYEGGFRYKA
jgi:hypothetical protein